MLIELIIMAALAHTVTYFLVGITAFTLFNYRATLEHPENNFRPASDPLVKAGVLFQPIRGALFGLVLFLLPGLLSQQNGWLVFWAILVIVGILNTFAPAGGSIEGFIYLRSSAGRNWGGLIEILVQSCLFSAILFYWFLNPTLWLNWALGVLFVIALALPTLGLLVQRKN